MVIWFLSRHSQNHSFTLSPQKVGGSREEDKEELAGADALPEAEGSSSVPPGPSSEKSEDIPSIPPAFTPSIKKTLAKPSVDPGKPIPALPSSITVALLKSRLAGKKTAKLATFSFLNVLLITPQKRVSISRRNDLVDRSLETL